MGTLIKREKKYADGTNDVEVHCLLTEEKKFGDQLYIINQDILDFDERTISKTDKLMYFVLTFKCFFNIFTHSGDLNWQQ